MNSKWIAILAAAALVIVGAVLLGRTRSGDAAGASAPGALGAASGAGAPNDPTPGPGPARCEFEKARAWSYDYSGRVDSSVSVGGMNQPIAGTDVFSGKLAFEALERLPDGWVLLGQFSGMNRETLEARGSQLEAPFLVKIGASCDVRGFARLKTVPRTAAQVQQVALHDFWVQLPATDGSQPVSFENGTGLANAVVTRRGSELTRTISSYQHVWRVKSAFRVTQSAARATFGADWLEEFESREGVSGGMVQSALLSLKLKRQRPSTAQVAADASRRTADYAWENLLSGDFSDTSADVAAVPLSERPYVEQMKDATIESAFATLTQKVADRANIEEQWHEMAGFLNGHPEQVAEFARGITEPEFPESAKGVAFLVLSKTVHPQARDALLELRRSPAMPPQDRLRAGLALVTRKDVGVELARELRQDALEGEPTRRSSAESGNALMELSILGSTHKSNDEVRAVAHDAVSQALASAGEDRPLLLKALGAVGNLGDLSLLSKVEAYTHHPDPEVRAMVPQAMRQYRYGDVEGFWLSWMARETSPDVMQEIFDLVYHQLADAQRPAGEAMVMEAARYLTLQPRVFARQSIVHIIGPTKDQYPYVKTVLIAQLGEEFRSKSGVYSQIAYYLSPEEISYGLSMLPEFAHQYGAQASEQARQAMVEAERRRTDDRVRGAAIRPPIDAAGRGSR